MSIDHTFINVDPMPEDSLRTLRCPQCGDGNVHIELDRVATHVTDDYTAPIGTRGSWVEIPAWCENGLHAWRVVFGSHKGETYAGTADDPEGERLLRCRDRFYGPVG